jgi:hypothetical protein
MREEKLCYMEQDREWTTIRSKNHRALPFANTSHRPTIQIYRPHSDTLGHPNPLRGAKQSQLDLPDHLLMLLDLIPA